MNLSQVDLVVLGAAETAVGGFSGDDTEILGMNYQFQRAGAGAVMASLWQIDDYATALLMADFYAGLAAEQAPAVALRQAQLVALHQGKAERVKAEVAVQSKEGAGSSSHPYYWAGFVVTGRGL